MIFITVIKIFKSKTTVIVILVSKSSHLLLATVSFTLAATLRLSISLNLIVIY